jgi:hypothetical protein
VIHHFQDIHYACVVVYASDKPVTIVPYVEHDAASDLISRTEGLLERSEMFPIYVLGYLMPRFEVFLGSPGIMRSGFPKPNQGLPFDDYHPPPAVRLTRRKCLFEG